MKHTVKRQIGILVVLAVALAACSGGAAVTGIEQSGGAVGPQEIENATEVLKFDPASIPTGGDAVPGACGESAVVPGTYRCELAEGVAEPCFPLGGTRLLCDPDPVAGTVAQLVSPTDSLPAIIPPSPDRAVVFFVELADGMTCAVRTAPEPVIVGGIAASYDCNAPYTYLLGEDQSFVFGKDAPTWEAGVYTLDPATGASPSGKVPKDIARVWIP
jgi:hypothetical protein